jgi:hypothetical protein
MGSTDSQGPNWWAISNKKSKLATDCFGKTKFERNKSKKKVVCYFWGRLIGLY